MLVSAAARSTATAIIVPFILLCAFLFEQDHYDVPEICLFFPDQMAEVYISIKDFALVEIGGKVMDIAGVILPAYLAACLLLQPVLYGGL